MTNCSPLFLFADEIQNFQISVEIRRITQRQVDQIRFDHDGLVMREGVEGLSAVICAVSAGSDAAERKFRIDEVSDRFIDRDSAGRGAGQKLFKFTESI